MLFQYHVLERKKKKTNANTSKINNIVQLTERMNKTHITLKNVVVQVLQII